jgi:hypothetical protein
MTRRRRLPARQSAGANDLMKTILILSQAFTTWISLAACGQDRSESSRRIHASPKDRIRWMHDRIMFSLSLNPFGISDRITVPEMFGSILRVPMEKRQIGVATPVSTASGTGFAPPTFDTD